MNLCMNRIHMPEVSWREDNRLLVENFGRRHCGAGRGEKHGFGKSRMHEVREECGTIPTGKSWAANIDEIDFDPVPYDAVRQTVKKRFPRLQLIERGVDKIH